MNIEMVNPLFPAAWEAVADARARENLARDDCVAARDGNGVVPPAARAEWREIVNAAEDALARARLVPFLSPGPRQGPPSGPGEIARAAETMLKDAAARRRLDDAQMEWVVESSSGFETAEVVLRIVCHHKDPWPDPDPGYLVPEYDPWRDELVDIAAEIASRAAIPDVVAMAGMPPPDWTDTEEIVAGNVWECEKYEYDALSVLAKWTFGK